MNNLLLNSYNLSSCQILQSLFVSEYGLRHLAQAELDESNKLGHRVIAAIELCPVIGFVATIIEMIVARCIQSNPILNGNWLFRGTQSNCTGDVSIAKVEAIRTRLNLQSAPGTRFSEAKVHNYIEGGACTAMSLEFLASYMEISKSCVQNPRQQPESLKNRIGQIGSKFAVCSEELRNRQAAYNTIEVVKQVNAVDYSRNKIQSLANYHSFAIDYSSDEIDFQQAIDENEFSNKMKALPDGAYFIRRLCCVNP